MYRYVVAIPNELGRIAGTYAASRNYRFMNKLSRQRLILERVQAARPNELLSTKDLAAQFDVSEATIRRDFRVLAKAGLIQRQYGGAQLTLAPLRPTVGQVGVILSSRTDKFRDPFYNMMLEGVDRVLERRGYQIGYVKILYEIDSAENARRLLESFKIDGLILLGTDLRDRIGHLRECFSPVVPIVTTDDKYDTEDDVILFDGAKGMRKLVGHLVSLGHRRLGFVSGNVDNRYEGFCQGLEAYNLPSYVALHQILEPGPSGWTPELGERGARILMTKEPRPDAIVCASDRLAFGAMGWLQRNGFRVPEDIAVTGFDNIPDAEFVFSPLTTVDVQKGLMGELAAERLVQRIEKPDHRYLKIITPISLVVRQSCGARLQNGE